MLKLLATVGVCLSLLALPAFADATQEIETAAAHAGAAAAADIPKTLRFHIQQAINCLVGPTGAGFNRGPGNPCDAMGRGAIADSSPAARKNLEAAVVKADQALTDPDLAAARGYAGDAAALLSQ